MARTPRRAAHHPDPPGAPGGEAAGDGTETPVARLRGLVELTRPVATADQRLLPVLPELEGLFSSGGLRRGSVIGVGGSAGATSLALAVAAGPVGAGSWVACVGGETTGWAAAHELGVELSRLVVVRTPDSAWPGVTAALVDAFEVVLCTLDRAPTRADARRLHARARERGAVLVVLAGSSGVSGRPPQRWPEAPDVALRVVGGEWTGLGQGSGRLGARRLVVEVDGRRGSARRRRVELVLPGPDGAPSPGSTSEQVQHREHGAVGSAAAIPLRRVG